jgi:hypothetical protein
VGRIMAPEDFRYVWTLSRRTWYVRFYLWLWEANAKELTFCKLFWGYTLLWVALPFKFLALVLRAFGRTRRRFVRARRLHREQRIEAEARERIAAPAEEPKPTRLLVTNRRIHEETKIELPHEENRALQRFHRWTSVAIEYGDGISEELSWSVPEFKHYYSAPGTYEVVVRLRREDYDIALRKYVYIDKVVIHQTIRIKDRPRAARVLETVEGHTSKGLMHVSAFRHTVDEAGASAVRSFTAVAKPATDVIAPVVVYPVRLVFRSIVRATALVLGTLLVGTVALAAFLGGSAGYHAVVESLPTLESVAGYVAIGLGLGLLVPALAWLLYRLGLMFAFKQAVIEPTVEGVAKGGVSFCHAMLIGYKAVKSNTCPRVVIEEDEE